MLTMKCVKHTISPNRYPTRAEYNGSYNPSTYFINVGDYIEVTDMKPHNGDIICQIGNIRNADGTSTSVLSGRWFSYDKDYFK